MSTPTGEALAVQQTANTAEVITGNEQAKATIVNNTKVET